MPVPSAVCAVHDFKSRPTGQRGQVVRTRQPQGRAEQRDRFHSPRHCLSPSRHWMHAVSALQSGARLSPYRDAVCVNVCSTLRLPKYDQLPDAASTAHPMGAKVNHTQLAGIHPQCTLECTVTIASPSPLTNRSWWGTDLSSSTYGKSM